MSQQVKVVGLQEFLTGMRVLAVRVIDTSTDIGLEVANLVVERARPNVPVRSGDAADSLQAFVSDSVAKAQGGEGIAYYRWLELGGASGVGGSNVRSESEGRYLKPAYEDIQSQIPEIMALSLSKATIESGLGR